MSADFDLVQVLRDRLADQPWYQRSANTVTAIITLGVNVLWVLTSLGVDVDPTVVAGVAAAIQVLGVVGIRLTPNGVTQRQIRDVEAFVGRGALEREVRPPNVGDSGRTLGVPDVGLRLPERAIPGVNVLLDAALAETPNAPEVLEVLEAALAETPNVVRTVESATSAWEKALRGDRR